MTTPHHDNDEHDAWLHEALRHAPDADVAPAPALRERILRAAHAPLRIQPPVQAGWAVRLWVWLAQPAVGAGLASVMLATVIGVMWQGQPLPERPAPVPIAAPSSPATETPAAPAREIEPQRAPPVATPAPRPQPAAKAARREAPAPLATTAPPPSPTIAADTSAPTPTAGAPAAARLREATPAAAPAPAQQFGSAVARERRAERSTSGLAALSAALAREPQRWSWQRDDDTRTQPVDARLADWLADAQRAATRWTSDDNDAVLPAGTRLRLLRDGRLAHTLVLGDAQLHWRAADAARGEHAALSEAEARALRDALQRIGP